MTWLLQTLPLRCEQNQNQNNTSTAAYFRIDQLAWITKKQNQDILSGAFQESELPTQCHDFLAIARRPGSQILEQFYRKMGAFDRHNSPPCADIWVGTGGPILYFSGILARYWRSCVRTQ